MKVNPTPVIPRPVKIASFTDVTLFETAMVSSLVAELINYANRLNSIPAGDGTETPTGPVRLNSFVKTALPAAVSYPAGLIYVSNDVGGAVVAFSDGTNWRRVTDRNIIS